MLQDIVADRFVVDGELVVEIEGRVAFDALQMRLHPAESRIRKLAVETPARLILFDILVAPEGANLMGEPLSRRRQELETFMATSKVAKRLELSPSTHNLKRALQWLGEAGHDATDGVVVKALAQAYAPGERAMVKVKPLRTADCVIGGFRYLARSKQVGSLLLGLYDGQGKLDHVGFTSTISDEERPALTKRLEKLRAAPGFTGKAPGGPSRWNNERTAEWEPLKPTLVVEVRFDQVTGARFRHGTRLLRWRPDKRATQCTMAQIAPPAMP
jgi:ATP-dependent DNA ligase